MKCFVMIIGAAALVATIAGCEGLAAVAGAAIEPAHVTVVLANNSPDFNVEVKLAYHADDDALETVIETVGEEVNTTVPAGTSVTVAVVDCDELQAIFIDDADLELVGGLGPEANTRVYRGDGEDFDCGDTITFTFSHDDVALPMALDIDFSAG